jgi:predicted DNA-binding protein
MAKQKLEFPRGYLVVEINKTLNIGGEAIPSVLYQVTTKKNLTPKTFINKEAVHKYINELERTKLEAKALKMSGYQHIRGVVQKHNELIAVAELEEISKI